VKFSQQRSFPDLVDVAVRLHRGLL
jgi:hypothetical protein